MRFLPAVALLCVGCSKTHIDANTSFAVGIDSGNALADVTVTFTKGDPLGAQGIDVDATVKVNGVVISATDNIVNVRGSIINAGRHYTILLPKPADGRYVLEVGDLTATATAVPIVFADEPAVIGTGQVTITWTPDAIVDEHVNLQIVGCEDRHLVSSTPRSATFDVTFPQGWCSSPDGYLLFHDQRETPLSGDLSGDILVTRETRRPVTLTP